MIGLRVQTVFRARAVHDAVASGQRRYLYRAAGYVRTIARRSIRKAKGKSQPGQPPKSHVGRLKQSIRFAVEATKAVIGPIRVWSKHQSSALPGCALLEKGGTAIRTSKRGGVRRIRYRPRPFMGPALETATRKLPDMWRDAVG